MIRTGRLALLAVAIVLSATHPASAQVRRQGCYDTQAGQVLRRYFSPVEQREVLILFDRTVEYPADVRNHVTTQMLRLSVPGTRVTIGSFSAYIGTDHYPRVDLSYLFESSIPPQLMKRLPRLHRDAVHRCLITARLVGLQRVRETMNSEFARARPSIPRSAILSSIHQFSDRLRASRARRKTLVIVSDMLENSSTYSFYSGHRPGSIAPQLALGAARRDNLITNLMGADVYVIGMAMVPGRHVLPEDSVQRLERFWRAYFAASRAGPVTVGKPVLLRDAQ